MNARSTSRYLDGHKNSACFIDRSKRSFDKWSDFLFPLHSGTLRLVFWTKTQGRGSTERQKASALSALMHGDLGGMMYTSTLGGNMDRKREKGRRDGRTAKKVYSQAHDDKF